MPENAQPSPVIVSLSCGASTVLSRMLQAAGWNKSPKEKLCAGKVQLKLEDIVLSQPDPVATDATSPGHLAATLAYNKAMHLWDRTQAPALEVSELQFQTVQTCLKYFTAREDTGSNRFLAELQEAFRVTE